jgi:isopenicillin N synthase-like dioxygenase
MTGTQVPGIPVVDLGGEPSAVAAAVRTACAEVGFLQVTGHGVDPVVVDQAWYAARAFFDLPTTDKLAAARRAPVDAYGYIPLEVESLNRSLDDSAAPADLKETFNMGPPVVPGRPLVDDGERWAFAPTPFPPALPALQPALADYFTALLDLSARMMGWFAMALGLPRDYFAALIDESPSALRVIDYPHREQPPLPGQLRAGAHTDYGTLTLLLQDDAPGGLEVLDPRTEQWTAVPAVPGAFVVNLGDLMARWTNDRWRSTLHRVVNPPTDGTGSTRRQSIALFHNANYHAVVECLPTCLAPGETPRHEPVEAGPHLMSKFHRTVRNEA